MLKKVSLLIALSCTIFLLYFNFHTGIDTQQENLQKQRANYEDKLEEKTYPYEGLYMAKQYPSQVPALDAKKRALNEAIRMTKEGLRSDGSWEVQGPGNIGGRVNTIAIQPGNDKVIFAGFSNGGLWRTIDGGDNWIPVFDDQPLTAIGDIEFHPTEPNTIFVGTGDPNVNGYYFVGNGLFKSEDLGETWTYLGLEEASIISTIQIAKSDPNIMYVGTMGKPYERNEDRGVYKSTDGGKTWENSLFIDEQSGAIEVILHPNNPDIVYAAGWTRIRTNKESTLNSDTAGVYKTLDGGITWNRLYGGLPQNQANSRVGIAMSPQNPDVLYCIVIGINQNPEGLYRTSDGGVTWDKWNVTDPQFFTYTSGFGWYFGKLTVHPYNEDKVYLLGVNLYSVEKQDTFAFTLEAPNWGSYEVHADKHDLLIVNDHMYLGTDGGLYKATLSSTNRIWEDIENIPTNQFYRVAYNPHIPEYYTGGMQDNGTAGGNKNTINEWERLRGGDGFQPAYYKNDPNVWFAESQNGRVFYSENAGVNWTSFTQGLGSDRHWDMQYILSPDNDNIAYATTNQVMMSVGLPENWVAISDTLVDYNKEAFQHVGTCIDQSSLDARVIYTGTSDGLVWGTKDAGNTWTHFTNGLPDRYVSSIKASPNVVGNAYVTYSGYRDGIQDPLIYKTSDYGQSWVPIHGNLPDLAISDVYVYPYRDNDEVLFVGTDGGVYFTIDNGENWERLGNNMPMVPVFDMDLNVDYNQIIAGTFGRSIMTFDLDQIGITKVLSNSKELDIAINIYPNPSNDIIHIACDQCRGKNYQILAADGRFMTKGIYQNTPQEINVSNYSKGVYYISINNSTRSIIVN